MMGGRSRRRGGRVREGRGKEEGSKLMGRCGEQAVAHVHGMIDDLQNTHTNSPNAQQQSRADVVSEKDEGTV